MGAGRTLSVEMRLLYSEMACLDGSVPLVTLTTINGHKLFCSVHRIYEVQSRPIALRMLKTPITSCRRADHDKALCRVRSVALLLDAFC